LLSCCALGWHRFLQPLELTMATKNHLDRAGAGRSDCAAKK